MMVSNDSKNNHLLQIMMLLLLLLLNIASVVVVVAFGVVSNVDSSASSNCNHVFTNCNYNRMNNCRQQSITWNRLISTLSLSLDGSDQVDAIRTKTATSSAAAASTNTFNIEYTKEQIMMSTTRNTNESTLTTKKKQKKNKYEQYSKVQPERGERRYQDPMDTLIEESIMKNQQLVADVLNEKMEPTRKQLESIEPLPDIMFPDTKTINVRASTRNK
jgi:hypothetical protein